MYTKFLFFSGANEILASIFKRAKEKKSENFSHFYRFSGSNESMEILHYNFDKDKKRFYNWG